MKKEYEKFFLGITILQVEDVVRTSLVGGTDDDGDNFGDIGSFTPFQ